MLLSGQIRTKAYTVMGIVNEYSYSGFSKCFALPEQFMNEMCIRDRMIPKDAEKPVDGRMKTRNKQEENHGI